MVFVSLLSLILVNFLGLAITVFAFDNTRFDNLAVYWGQDSVGAANPGNPANFQKTLSFYCADNTIDAIPVAFVTTFFGTGGLPVLNLANTCNNVDNATFPGSELANCAALASDITTCQAKGKIVTVSLGGAGGSVGFSSDAQAAQFADQIWNLFLGGSSSTRPFGSAVLDGVDLDIEGGGSSGYTAFVNQLRTHFSGASKPYYITAAPQCVFPDASLGTVLNEAFFDAVYVQFYNNQCGLQNFATSSDWDFGLWDNWARTTSINKNVKVYIGSPASSSAAGSGWQDPATFANILTKTRNSFPSFGGAMLWDASQAFANNRYDQSTKNALVAAGGTGFTFPPCSAPAYVSGTSYTGGSQVSFQGYIWQAKFFADMAPVNDPNNDWSAISACSGGAPSSTSSTSTPTTTSSSQSSTSSPSSSSSSSSPTPTSGNCAGVPAWDSSVAYQGGSEVTSGGHLWTAKWWSEADVPGGPAGDWTDDGPCVTGAAATGKASPAIGTKSPAASHKPVASINPVISASARSGSFAHVPTSAVGTAVRASTSGLASQKTNGSGVPRNVQPRSSRFFRI